MKTTTKIHHLLRAVFSLLVKFGSTHSAAALLVLYLLLAGVWLPRALAMPASPWPFVEHQPDGQRVTVFLRGDEHFHWLCDREGFTVVRDAGWYVYAQRDARERLVPTALRVGTHDPKASGLTPGLVPGGASRPVSPLADAGGVRARDPQEAAAAVVGTRKNLVVLLRFSNHASRLVPPEADIDVLLNAVGGDPTLAPTGSVRDAYRENSYGQFTLDSTVAYWVTLPNTEAYYANGDSGLTTRTHEALKYTLDVLEADPNFSFLPFDQDNDHNIDVITFLHSGYGAEWGGTSSDGAYYTDRIWSHKWSLRHRWVGAENVAVTQYHISPAIWGTSGTAIGRIGVICHETGHFLGLPDLYDGNDSDGDGRAGQGIGSYCLMANSWGFDGTQRYLPHMSAWCKIQMGWVVPGLITSEGPYSLRQQETYPDVWRINLGYPSGEYLLVENRQRIGLDGDLPQGGLAIYHIDEATGDTSEGHPWQTGWPANGRHYRVALLQADGSYDLERGFDRGDAYDVYHAGGVKELGPNGNGSGSAYPNTDAYKSGVIISTGNRLFNISAAAETMTFDFEAIGQSGLPAAPSDLRATAIQARRIALTWADRSSNEQGFQIQRATNDIFDSPTVINVGANKTGYTDSKLVAGTLYYYRIRSYNAAGYSGWSNTASATAAN